MTGNVFGVRFRRLSWKVNTKPLGVQKNNEEESFDTFFRAKLNLTTLQTGPASRRSVTGQLRLVSKRTTVICTI